MQGGFGGPHPLGMWIWSRSSSTGRQLTVSPSWPFGGIMLSGLPGRERAGRMTLILLTAGSFAGGLLFGLLGARLLVLRRRRRRTLAFALAGEISGILRLIESGGWEAGLRERARGGRPKQAESRVFTFFLPRAAIFEANAAALDLLGPSAARKVAQFHALLGGASGNASVMATNAGKAGIALAQLEEALSLADDILRDLQPMLRASWFRRA